MKEDVENGYYTTEEHSNAMQHMQTSNTIHGDVQSVSRENTERNYIGQIRPQSSTSAGQRDTVRSGRGQETVLSAESDKQGKQVGTVEENFPIWN